MDFDWDAIYKANDEVYKRDGFDFSDSKYSKDLYKIMYFVYTYGKGYPSVDFFYEWDFQMDVTSENYENIADNEFCLEALRLLKRIRTIDYPFGMMENFFCSKIVENILDDEEPSTDEYIRIRSILVEDDLIPALKIEDVDAEYYSNIAGE